VAALALAVGVPLAVLLVKGRQTTVEVLNQTSAPIENVRLTFLRSGKTISFPTIAAGRSAGGPKPKGETNLITLTYDQGGERHEIARVGYPDEPMLEPKVQILIIPDLLRPGSNGFAIRRRKVYDPSRFFGP